MKRILMIFAFMFLLAGPAQPSEDSCPMCNVFTNMHRWDPFEEWGGWKHYFFSRWLGRGGYKIYMTFPVTQYKGIMRTYGGKWAHKVTVPKIKDPVIMDGDYEFNYVKFRGVNLDQKYVTFHFYRLRMDGDAMIPKAKEISFIIRDFEVQQSDYEPNFVRGSAGLGYNFKIYESKKDVISTRQAAITAQIFAGVLAQLKTPGLMKHKIPVQDVENGGGPTTGLKIKFQWWIMHGEIKYQFTYHNAEKFRHKISGRIGIRGIIREDDLLALQADSEFPNDALNAFKGNMYFITYNVRW